jgi:hypothetical protein
MLCVGAAILWLADRWGSKKREMDSLTFRRGARHRRGPGHGPRARHQPLRHQHLRRPVPGPEPRGRGRFSFLMATPVVAGAGLWEARKLLTTRPASTRDEPRSSSASSPPRFRACSPSASCSSSCEAPAGDRLSSSTASRRRSSSSSSCFRRTAPEGGRRSWRSSSSCGSGRSATCWRSARSGPSRSWPPRCASAASGPRRPRSAATSPSWG